MPSQCHFLRHGAERLVHEFQCSWFCSIPAWQRITNKLAWLLSLTCLCYRDCSKMRWRLIVQWSLTARLSRALIGSRRWRNDWRHGITGTTTLRHRRRHVYDARRMSHALLIDCSSANRSIAPVASLWRIQSLADHVRVTSSHFSNRPVYYASLFRAYIYCGSLSCCQLPKLLTIFGISVSLLVSLCINQKWTNWPSGWF